MPALGMPILSITTEETQDAARTPLNHGPADVPASRHEIYPEAVAPKHNKERRFLPDSRFDLNEHGHEW